MYLSYKTIIKNIPTEYQHHCWYFKKNYPTPVSLPKCAFHGIAFGIDEVKCLVFRAFSQKMNR